MKPGFFSDKSFSVKAVLCIASVAAGFCVTMLLMMIVLLISAPQEVLAGRMPELNAGQLRIIQTGQSLFAFIMPALLLAIFFSRKPKEYLYLEQKNNGIILFFVIAASIALIPFINWLAYLNQQLKLPASLHGIEKWMQESETNAAEIMKIMLQMDSIPSLLFNIFLIGFLAAVGEELLFRGIIQRLIADASKNIHLGIWISGIIFSAIHLQFYGFLPRMLLGVYFGYLLWWSKSLWLPVLAHFANNATAVILSYLEQRGVVESDIETVGESNTLIALISFIIFGIFLFSSYTLIQNKHKNL